MSYIHKYEAKLIASDIHPRYGVVRWEAARRLIEEAHEAMFAERGLCLAELLERGYAFMPVRDETVWKGPILASESPVVITRFEGVYDAPSLQGVRQSELKYTQAITVDERVKVHAKLVFAFCERGRRAVLPQDIRARVEG
ncbi:hypothetical protein C4580_03185 [Candidatus Woesearchaeota archaeon]|nr:MAG: hypothetical protein C4580_03185 [Candidatus Woesearchaeota archaeon]